MARLARTVTVRVITMTISEAGALSGLTASTLRFYERERLFFAPVRRDAAGRRVFTQDEVDWLRVCTRLRSSGMPLPEIRHYAELVEAGSGNEEERMAILTQHEQLVQRQIEDLHEALSVIQHKVEVYSRAMAEDRADTIWTAGPEC